MTSKSKEFEFQIGIAPSTTIHPDDSSQFTEIFREHYVFHAKIAFIHFQKVSSNKFSICFECVNTQASLNPST